MKRYPRRGTVSTKRGVVRRVVQDFAEFLNGGVDAFFEINEGSVRPEAFLQILAGNDVAWTLQQHQQNLKRLLLKPQPNPALAQLARASVELENAEAKNVLTLWVVGYHRFPRPTPCRG